MPSALAALQNPWPGGLHGVHGGRPLGMQRRAAHGRGLGRFDTLRSVTRVARGA